MILYMYIALGQGQKTPWGQITFDVNRTKKIALKSDIMYTFFSAVADNPLGSKF